MIKNIEKKLFESKYSKVSGFSKNGNTLKVLVESEEFEVSEDENGINMISDGVDMTSMTEEEVDQQLGLLTESQSSVDKKDLANILSINNVKGRLIKDTDVPDAVLTKFNKALPSFVKKYPKFDLFGDDYDGEETDIFVELLIAASKGTKVDLFENADSMVDEIVASENPEEKLVDVQSNDIPLMEAKSARVGGFAKSKLTESLGNPFKTDTLAYKIKKGLKLTESIYEEIAKLTGARPTAVEDFLTKRLEMTDKDVEAIYSVLKRKVLSGADFTTAMLGKPNNKFEKTLLKKLGESQEIKLVESDVNTIKKMFVDDVVLVPDKPFKISLIVNKFGDETNLEIDVRQFLGGSNQQLMTSTKKAFNDMLKKYQPNKLFPNIDAEKIANIFLDKDIGDSKKINLKNQKDVFDFSAKLDNVLKSLSK